MQHFIKDIRVKLCIPNSPQFPDIVQNSDKDITEGNSRTSDDIDMKLGLVTNLDKKNKQRQKKLTMMPWLLRHGYFPIYGQFGAIRTPNSGCIVCKTYIFINSNFLSYKIWKQN